MVLAGRRVRRRTHHFVLGHALAMKAIHGSKSKNDKIDSHKIAHLLRGGLLPQSYVYPAAMRSTRDFLRRRLHLVRKRGQLLAHIQNTRAQYKVPEFARRLAYPANREGVPEWFPDASVRKSVEDDLALLERYDGSSPTSNTRWSAPRNSMMPTRFTACGPCPASGRCWR